MQAVVNTAHRLSEVAVKSLKFLPREHGGRAGTTAEEIALPANQKVSSQKDLSDSELVSLAREGSEEAFRALVNRHRKKAYWVAYNLLRNHEEAQDVAQEAFIRVFRFLDRYDPSQQFTTWLYQIVTNLAIDSLRRNKSAKATGLDQVPELQDPREGPEHGVQRNEKRELVREILGELPEPYRVVLLLRDIEGLPSREVAEILKVNHSTVRWRLHLARALFKERWESRFGVGSGVED